ncbi:MAG: hypothetical protein DPW14_04480 [Planctomycetes bacterium]|nr:hypothetical protein [Planctomycetota bacterium]
MANKSEIFANLKIPKSSDITLGVLARTLRGKAASPTWIKAHISELVAGVQIAAYKDFKKHQLRAAPIAIADAVVEGLARRVSREDVRKAIKRAFPELNAFFLSLTQSRRSRAGDSFQVVMNELLRRLGYPFTPKPQLDGNPDLVLPSKAHYERSPMDCVVLTLKTTLRERWRQVVTEGAKGTHFYLATIDEKLSAKELGEMSAKKVFVVVPQSAKEGRYSAHDNVLSFEDFIEDHLDHRMKLWKKQGCIARRGNAWVYKPKGRTS